MRARALSIPRLLGVTAAVALALALPAAPALANSINVTTQSDEVDAGEECSLREAVIAADFDTTGPGHDCVTGSGPDTIHVPASANSYTLDHTGAGENVAATGDLDLLEDVTIIGGGAGSTTIDGNGTDRVFDVLTGTYEIRDLTVTNGKTVDGTPGDAGGTPPSPGSSSNGSDANSALSGAGIRNDSILTLTRVTVTGNVGGDGGAGGAGGTGANGAAAGAGGDALGGAGGNGASGGGIANTGGLTVENSRITQNVAGDGGPGGAGGTGGNGGADVGAGGRSAGGVGGFGGSGGGIFQTAGGTTSITNTLIAANRAGDSGPGGDGGQGGTGGTSSTGTGGIGGETDGGGSFFAGAGGGVEAESGEVTIEGSTITGNSSGDGGTGGDAGHGGAGGAGSAAANTGEGGVSTGGTGGSAGFGAGLDLFGTKATVSGSAVVNNSAGVGGDGGDGGTGGAGSAEGDPSGGNGTPGGLAGGMNLGAADTTATNVTVASNHAGDGGDGGTAGTAVSDGTPIAGSGGQGGSDAGVIQASGAGVLTHVTVAGNSVGSGGASGGSGGTPGAGGVDGGAVEGVSGDLTLRNSLVASNGGDECAGVITDGGHNLSFPNDLSCPATRHGNPQLSALGNHGGPTPTRTLGNGSQAIDGAATGLPCTPADQRGLPRPAGPACDIGAAERSLPTAVTGGATGVTTSGAHVAGTANPRRLAATYRFRFGTTTAYGSQTAAVSAGSGAATVPAAATLAGLAPNTTYHYRLVVTNVDGSAAGADRTFRTRALGFTGAPILTRKAKVRRKRAKIKVACPARAVTRCTGTLRLTTKVKKNGKTRTLKLGRKTFDIGAGKRKTLRVKISKTGRKLLRKRKKLKVRARTSAVDARGGTPVVRTRKVTLR